MCTKHRSGPAKYTVPDGHFEGRVLDIPAGYSVVKGGNVQAGDLLYDTTNEDFREYPRATGMPVSGRVCVVRKTSLLESGLANQRKAKEALVALKGEAPIELGPKETIMVTHNYNGRKIKSIIPIGYEIVDDGVTLEGDKILQLYDDGGNSYNPAPVGFQVSAFTLVVRNAKPVFVDPKHLAKPGQAEVIAALLEAMLEYEPHSMEHLLLERAYVDEDIAHLAEVDVLAKSDCEFYMNGFTLINTIVKKLTGKELIMDVRDSEIHSIKVKS